MLSLLGCLFRNCDWLAPKLKQCTLTPPLTFVDARLATADSHSLRTPQKRRHGGCARRSKTFALVSQLRWFRVCVPTGALVDISEPAVCLPALKLSGLLKDITKHHEDFVRCEDVETAAAVKEAMNLV